MRKCGAEEQRWRANFLCFPVLVTDCWININLMVVNMLWYSISIRLYTFCMILTSTQPLLEPGVMSERKAEMRSEDLASKLFALSQSFIIIWWGYRHDKQECHQKSPHFSSRASTYKLLSTVTPSPRLVGEIPDRLEINISNWRCWTSDTSSLYHHLHLAPEKLWMTG